MAGPEEISFTFFPDNHWLPLVKHIHLYFTTEPLFVVYETTSTDLPSDRWFGPSAAGRADPGRSVWYGLIAGPGLG